MRKWGVGRVVGMKLRNSVFISIRFPFISCISANFCYEPAMLVNKSWGQSHKSLYTIWKIYKLVLLRDNWTKIFSRNGRTAPHKVSTGLCFSYPSNLHFTQLILHYPGAQTCYRIGPRIEFPQPKKIDLANIQLLLYAKYFVMLWYIQNTIATEDFISRG
jgi:hypothetical protein